VTEAATPYGLFPLSGSSPDVGVVGYTLGGGLSWLGRKHGLAASHVTAIELVTSDGELVRATEEQNADLFWALRGGGGSFGVVTAMEFRLFPYGDVYAGMFLWPYERHAELLRAWYAWTRSAPDDVTTSFRIMHMPPLPDLPPFLAGRSVVVIDGAFAGAAEDGAAAVAELRALAPEIDTWAAATPAALSRIHMDPEEPIPYESAGALLGELDADALEAFAAPIAPGAPLLFGELRHLGGALARVPQGAGALARLDGEYLMFGAGVIMGPEAVAPLRGALRAFKASLADYDTGAMYLNFAEEPTDAARFYADATYWRLRAIRRAIDPAERMVGNHPIPGA
jgi:hypothetical protein